MIAPALEIPPSPRYARVAVATAAGGVTALYDYRVPDGLAVGVGQLVVVPFGARRTQGIVVALPDAPAVEETRSVEALIDHLPVVTEPQLALARWIAERYLAPFGRVLESMVPPGLRSRFDQRLSLRDRPSDQMPLRPGERRVVEYLRERGPTNLRSLRERLELPRAADVAARLARRGLIERRHVISPSALRLRGPTLALLTPEGRAAAADPRVVQRAPRRAEVLAFLAGQAGGRADAEFLRGETGADAATLRGLVRCGWVRLADAPAPIRAVERLVAPTRPLRLTEEQETAVGKLIAALDAPQPRSFLLHGVTASGKTEVYIRLIQAALARGRRALVLVPEIGLTPQAVHRYGARFPGRVAALHSRLTPSDRFEAWRRIRDGRADVVVGSRSALFAPIPELGVVVVDEEHEPSYKQSTSPRYHAREAALVLGRLTRSVVVLGSATPDVETYERAWRGELELLQMTRRATASPGRGSALPVVEVVDMRRALADGGDPLFSPRLLKLLGETLARGEQSILFLNRRGAATVVICASCGHVPRCRRCDVTQVYHTVGDEMLCHQCNRREKPRETCPDCGSTRLQYLGAGTQRVVLELNRLFPTARVLRWDKDAMRRRLAAEQLTAAFTNREADILVGTQAIAKGLDLPDVTLVGIVTADTVLHLPDVRSVERTFQLLSQVSGRAGRGTRPGRVVLQTFSPDHPCVLAAARHNYAAFAQHELGFRREQGYPPYGVLVRGVFGASSLAVAREACARQAAAVKGAILRLGLAEVDIVGPAPCYYGRVRGQHRWQIVLRGAGAREAASTVAWPPGWAVDVDPVSLL